MLLPIVITLLCASAATLGYCVGLRRASGELAERLRDDPEVGPRVLEQLARRWGARLELTDTTGGRPVPSSNG